MMLTIGIGRNDMRDKAPQKDIDHIDWDATEREYARQLEKAFGNREITVAYSDVAPTDAIKGDYTDSYDVHSILQDVWDRQSFWKYKQYQ